MLVSLLILLYYKSIIIGIDLTGGHTPSTTSSKTFLQTWVQIMYGSLSKYNKHHCTPLSVRNIHEVQSFLTSWLMLLHAKVMVASNSVC